MTKDKIKSDPKTVARLLADLQEREENERDRPHNNPVPGSRRASRQGYGK